VIAAIEAGECTADIGGELGCSAFTEVVARRLEASLQGA
jgi:hypothetical protein